MELIPAPVLQAEHMEGGGWRVWCAHCLRYHYHGARPGHRVAHCVRSTPYIATGYVLLAPESPYRPRSGRAKPTTWPDPSSRGAA